MKYLVVYNTKTGSVVFMTNITDENVTYNGGVIIEIPDGKQLDKIDITTGQPVFIEYADPLDKVKNDITDIQVALAELYESGLSV